MKLTALILTLALATAGGAAAERRPPPPAEASAPFSARALTFEQFFAHRPGDPRVYVLFGGGFLRGVFYGDLGLYVSRWLTAHPAATAVPISRMVSTNTQTHQPSEMVYIWIDDGEHSLNVDMIRAGVAAGPLMFDMVDNQRGFDRFLQSPTNAELRADVEKERAAAPQDGVDRLIPTADYQARMRRVEAAERLARAEKRGIWSDAMKAERQSEGYP